MGYLARRYQAAACRFAVYPVNADGTKRATCPVSKHVTREAAEKSFKGCKGWGVFPI